LLSHLHSVLLLIGFVSIKSHILEVLEHCVHEGFLSSHFSCLILHVRHPLLDFGALRLVLLGLDSGGLITGLTMGSWALETIP